MISDSRYEKHFSNGANPQGAPNFCKSHETPGSIRVLVYNKKQIVEVIGGNGNQLSYCLIDRL